MTHYEFSLLMTDWILFARNIQVFPDHHYIVFVVTKGPGQIETLSAVVRLQKETSKHYIIDVVKYDPPVLLALEFSHRRVFLLLLLSLKQCTV